MPDDPTRLVQTTIDHHHADGEPSAAWGVWNVIAFTAGTAATMHLIAVFAPTDWIPMLAWLPGLYDMWIIKIWQGFFGWLVGDHLSAWVWNLPTYAYLFAMISVRATSSPGLEDHLWPISGKVTDYLIHMLLWPLVSLFYLLSLLRIVELIDPERAMEVRSTVWTFFTSIGFGAVLWGLNTVLAFQS